MLLNYLKITLQYLSRTALSTINIFGITFGFQCLALITLNLLDELSFNMLHIDAGWHHLSSIWHRPIP